MWDGHSLSVLSSQMHQFCQKTTPHPSGPHFRLSELFNLPRGQSTLHRSTFQALAQLGRRGGSQVATLETDIPLVHVRVEWLSPDCHLWEFHTCLPIVGARRARASTIR